MTDLANKKAVRDENLSRKLKNIAAAYGHTSHTTEFIPAARCSDLMILREYHDPETNIHYADCECRCGRRVAALRYTSVIRGIVRSCGCKERLARAARAVVLAQKARTRRFDHPLRKNMLGVEFGYLTVVDHVTVSSLDELPRSPDTRPQKLPRNGFFWVLECACGDRMYMSNETIKRNGRTSCVSSVCRGLYATDYPKNKVKWYIRLNFAGKIPKSAYKRTRKAVSSV